VRFLEDIIDNISAVNFYLQFHFIFLISGVERSMFFVTAHVECKDEELDGPAVSALGLRSRKLSNVLNGQS
jgi:hypothetical protein